MEGLASPTIEEVGVGAAGGWRGGGRGWWGSGMTEDRAEDGVMEDGAEEDDAARG
jgi:hypothetical protein